MNFTQYLKEAQIDRKAVMAAATKKAKQAFNDKVDMDKVNGMVNKAIDIAKDTEDAIGIVLGFFEEK